MAVVSNSAIITPNVILTILFFFCSIEDGDIHFILFFDEVFY